MTAWKVFKENLDCSADHAAVSRFHAPGCEGGKGKILERDGTKVRVRVEHLESSARLYQCPAESEDRPFLLQRGNFNSPQKGLGGSSHGT